MAQEAYVYGLQQAVFDETRFTFTQLEVAPNSGSRSWTSTATTTPINGWMVTKDMGNFGTDYPTRAAVADAGWVGLDRDQFHV